MNNFKFPPNFLWGASTSAFQIEGGYLEDGKGLSMADVRSLRPENKSKLNTKVTIDHYHRWHEDLALMKEMGIQSYRFSISWSRIFPNGDEEHPNKKGLEFYHHLIDCLLKNGIEPIVTIYHFDQPYVLVKKYGGWVSRKSVADYVKYAKVLLKEFSSQVHYWLTINEQAVMVVVPDMLGIDSSLSKSKQIAQAMQANYHMWLAQAEIYCFCHEHYPKLKIGPAISYLTTLPASQSADDMMAAKDLEDFYSFTQIDVALKGKIPVFFKNELKKIGVSIQTKPEDQQILEKGRANYLGINWYCTTIVKRLPNVPESNYILTRVKRIKNPHLQYTDWGWDFDPVGLHYALRQLLDRYGQVPIIITECGWSEKEKLEGSAVHDPERIRYLQEHIKQLQLSLADGVNVISFNIWSFIDLLSVSDGMGKRYGLIYVDRDNQSVKQQRRYKKDSFYWYRDFIKNGHL